MTRRIRPSGPLYRKSDSVRAEVIRRKRGQIVELVTSPGRNDVTQEYRGEVIGDAYNLRHGSPTDVVLRLEDGRLVTVSSAIVVSIENPVESSR